MARAKRSDGGPSAARSAAKDRALVRAPAGAGGPAPVSPVVGGERAEEWEAFRAAVVAALRPVGAPEEDLAERLAQLAWRIRRVLRYETAETRAAQAAAAVAARAAVPSPAGRPPAAVGAELERARAWAAARAADRDLFLRLAAAPDGHALAGAEACGLLEGAAAHLPPRPPRDEVAERYLLEARWMGIADAAGVPAEHRDAPERWGGWTATAVRAGVGVVAREGGLTGAELLERAVPGFTRAAAEAAARVAGLAAELEAAGREAARHAAELERAGAEAAARVVLPSEDVLDDVVHYESHLGRQYAQTLVLFKGLQAARMAAEAAAALNAAPPAASAPVPAAEAPGGGPAPAAGPVEQQRPRRLIQRARRPAP